ncbi:MAG: EAL domain-containing protein [Rhodopseudomonas sp.]|uniref:putative bifunctional diguanylate cyclase/phosphodiesterase n=1 Tax=Rhodopseudomonas sp. TaxID=1078 RepID=UPI0017AC54F6|nr:EAL domain-containing protein [Rhodopseudomonas sp.]NVN87402.1 EAL domain-containing protein [Rhodopseudomonas sp.]
MTQGKGKGLNSIAIRFGLMAAGFSALCVGAQLYFLAQPESARGAALAASCVLSILLPAAVTYLAARKLATQIGALRAGTEAIAAGNFDSPLEVDCACEVGGLADSFRKMVGRFNSNIVRMNALAHSDMVTGLPNRAVVAHMLSQLTAQDAAGEGAVMFIDLDGFKKINDVLGHEAGDELLRLVGDRIIHDGLDRQPEQLAAYTTTFGELRAEPPQGPVLARFAGDEFVLLFPGLTGADAVERHAEAILSAIRRPFLIWDNEVEISASIGIARTPIDSDDPAELLNFADLAMYAAKQGGKNRAAFFEPALRDDIVERSTIEADLRYALDYGGLSLHYQPQLDSQTLECVGVEALARWDHPTRGPVSPAIFIPIAEQAGLMPQLGAHIFRMAARQCREWLDAGIRRRVAINVSPIQFENPNLIRESLAILAEFDLDPGLIEIEITESMAMSDFAASQSRVRQFQDAGVQISIDDFGTGFSNLSQLAKMPFDSLKIDRSLIADIGSLPKSEAIIRAIVSMAHALGYSAIAEGIETPMQHQFLQRLHCDAVQGYLFARPLTATQLDRWEQGRSQNVVRNWQDNLSVQLR